MHDNDLKFSQTNLQVNLVRKMHHPNSNLQFQKYRNTWGSRAVQYSNSLEQILWEDNFDHYISISDIFRKVLKVRVNSENFSARSKISENSP